MFIYTLCSPVHFYEIYELCKQILSVLCSFLITVFDLVLVLVFINTFVTANPFTICLNSPSLIMTLLSNNCTCFHLICPIIPQHRQKYSVVKAKINCNYLSEK